MKIVINRCFGGFGLSHEAMMRYAEIKGMKLEARSDTSEFMSYYEISGDTSFYFSKHDIDRDDPALVQVVEELGNAANTKYSKLKVVTVPDGVQWQIEQYDGNEYIAERHRTWQ